MWWKNDNVEGDLVDCEMCVHVFGGTSSLGCCNYALSKTAVVKASDVKAEVAKSVESEDSAINLLQDVYGGFNLSLLPTEKGVFNSVPPNHWTDSVKNNDTDGKLPEERLSGICWDIERNSFKFKTDFKEKSIIRRGCKISCKFNIWPTWICGTFCHKYIYVYKFTSECHSQTTPSSERR